MHNTLENLTPTLRQIHNIEEGGLTEYCPGSIQDTRYGRDLKVNSEDLYYQIKPLNGYVKSSTIDEFKYAVPTNSMKKYNPNYVDRLMFINDKGSQSPENTGGGTRECKIPRYHVARIQHLLCLVFTVCIHYCISVRTV